MRVAIALGALALLAACGHKDDPVGTASPEEDRMLNEAASSLDVTPDNTAIDNSVLPMAQGNAQ